MNPAFKIIADKKDVTALIAQRLVSINVTDETGLVSDTCEILLDNRDEKLEIPSRGSVLEVFFGYENKPLSRMGSYIVDDIEVSSPPSQMRITSKANNALDRNLTKQIKAPKSKSWHGYTLVGIITAIANSHNLNSVIDEYFNQIYISHIDQTDESDISFLTTLSLRYGAFIKLTLGKLLFFQKGKSVSVNGIDLPLIKISKAEISSWNLKISDFEKFGKVIAKWHNFSSGKEEDVFVGSGDPAYNLRYKFTDKQRALSAATAKFAEFQKDKEKLNITLAGNPALSAENKIQIEGIKYLQDKKFIIESVTHSISDQGFISQLTATPKLENEQKE